MSAFDRDPATFARLDWALFQRWPAVLYHDRSILEEDVQWLLSEGYEVPVFECSLWTDISTAHEELKRVLGFPDYYGKNGHALEDSLRLTEYPGTGLIICLLHFDDFSQRLPKLAAGILGAISRAAHIKMLTGNRLLMLVQADEPGFQVPALDEHHLLINSREFRQRFSRARLARQTQLDNVRLSDSTE